MKFREHRGGLDESMQTVVDIKSRQELVEHIAKLLYPWNVDVTDGMVTVKPYGSGRDERIGWTDLHIVIVETFGVVGWVDGRPENGQENR